MSEHKYWYEKDSPREDAVSTTIEPEATPDTAVAVIEDSKPVPEEVPLEYQLVAVDGPQLVSAHGRMIGWARVQIATVAAEKQAEEESLAIAVERKWATAAFRRRISMLGKRKEYYEKIEQALLAGWVIVPNFEMNVFAIRTTKERPDQTRQFVHSWEHSKREFRQAAKALPAGEGEFKNPLAQSFSSSYEGTNAEGKPETQHYQQSYGGFQDIDFPIVLAKPVVMSKSAEAMAAKVFDEIGVARDSGQEAHRGSRVGDPFVLGRIRNPRKNRPDITFFIGWTFDPSRL